MNDELVAEPQVTEDRPEWAIVEIFGHRKHAGRIMEVERFGAKMLRIDVPKSEKPDAAMVSHFYGGASIFGLTHIDEASARKLKSPMRLITPSFRTFPMTVRIRNSTMINHSNLEEQCSMRREKHST